MKAELSNSDTSCRSWKVAKIGQIADVAYGYTEKASLEEVGPKFLRITDIQDDGVNWATVPYCRATPKEHLRHRLLAGDIVFARTGATTGKSFLIIDPPDAVCASYLIRLRLRSGTVLPEFVQLFFQTSAYWEVVEAGTSGSAQGGFNASKLADLSIPVPSLDEQRQIVAGLDKAFAAIATATAIARKNQSNARALFESYLQSIFAERGEGWIEEPINKNVRFVDYRGKTPPKRDAGVRLITAKNVKMGYVRRDPEEFIDAAAYDGWMTRGFPQRGDVLFTTEAPLGNIAQLDTDEKVVIGQRLITMQPKPKTVDRTFLKYMLCSAQLQQAIRAKGTGATVVGIKAKLLKLIPIFYPKRLEAQLEIVERLNSINARSQNLIGVYARQIAALAELKQSLLKKAFAGEFTAAMAEAVAPAANDNFATAQGTANMIAFAYWLHKKQNRDKSFKRIKAQKCLHNVESIAGIDLGRQPMKHRNGPHDEAHMSRAEDWAREQGFFEFVQSTSGPGYDFKKLGNYDAMWAETVAATKTIAAALERAIDPLIQMDMETAELFATVHAAWNNLIRNGAAITNDAIVKEARDEWHAEKLKIPEHKFRSTIRTIKAKGMEPDGSAKYVGGQASLF